MRTTPGRRQKAVQTPTYHTPKIYENLIDALIAAATEHMPDLAELVDRSSIKLALGEIGDIWPATIMDTGIPA